MTDPTKRTPLLHGATPVPALMRTVIVALLPAAVLHVAFFGIGLLLNAATAAVAAFASEAAILRIRGRPVRFFLTDYSAAVTAVLLAFALPPLTPWWVTATGAVFAVAVAKHFYGGIGQNVFNPAMAGYCAILVSFPEALSRWPVPAPAANSAAEPGALATLAYWAGGQLPSPLDWDSVSTATPLDSVQTQLGRMITMDEITASPLFGQFGGLGWEWINLAIAAGGIWLLRRGVIQWHIPFSMLGTLCAAAALFWLLDTDINPSPLFHVVAGSAVLGAFFIATDPVSAAASNRGRLIYGAGIGLLTFIIRRWGSYPDGVAFAVLLMNLAVPLIDRFTRPRIYGHER